MQQPTDNRIFTGVMDTDSAPFNIAAIDVRHRLNLINLYNDQGFGSNENVVSFLPLFNQFLTTAQQKCLGCFEDVKGNSIIFFIYSADKKHGIYRWYQAKGTNGTIEKIYQVQDVNNDCLNFQEDHLISHVNLVDELLIWTDGYNEPRCMNIVRANTTNKQRVFNLYFEPSAFVSAPATTYTLKVYTTTTQTFTWISASVTYVDRVQDFINAVSGDPTINQYIRVIDKINYAQVVINDIGDYMIEVTPSAYVVAENFYPDITPTTYSYAPLNSELITAVKYPPMCSPEVNYSSQYKNARFKGLFTSSTYYKGAFYPADPPIIPDPSYPNVYWTEKGISFIDYDYANCVVSGADITTSILNPTTYTDIYTNPNQSILNPNAYFINNTGVSTTLNIKITIDYKVSNTVAGITGDLFIKFGKYVADFTSPNPLYTLVQTIPNNSFTTTYNLNINANPGDKYFLWFAVSAADAVVSGSFEGSFTPIGLTNFLGNKTYKFRNRYRYKDEQESVLSSESIIPVPTSLVDNVIEINYQDPRLESLELVSDIKEVIMSVSDDNGTTWYDWKTLKPYEFVGINRQNVIFTGKETLIPVDSAKATLFYHNIPLKAKSQEYIDDRVFYGGITTGYDGIIPNYEFTLKSDTFTNDDYYNQSVPPNSLSYWKVGGKYEIGLVYYDDADRVSPVVVDPSSYQYSFPYWGDPNIPSNFPAFPYLQFNIFHEPPSWATKYQWVRTRDLTNSQFLMWVTDDLTFYDNKGNVTTNSGLVDTIKISFANIPYYSDKYNVGAKIDFPYVDGDRIRFIRSATGLLYNQNDYNIIKVDGTDVYIKSDGYIGIPGSTPYGGQLVEIYSPSQISSEKPFYEFSECYEIKEDTFDGIKRKYHTADIVNQSYGSFPLNNVTSASGLLRNGDVWSRRRFMPYNSSASNPPILQYDIQSTSPSEYIVANGPNNPYDNNGRPNTTELIGQLYQPTGVVFTNRYISNTKINGLNAVEGGNTRQYSTIYGDLNCMRVLNNDILRLIFGNGYQLSIYVNQGVIRQSGGGMNLISIYDDVAANSHIIQKTLGTLNAESCVVNDEGDLFGWDETEGVDWLSASNDLVQVSEYKMMNVFNDYGQTRRLLDKTKSHTPAVYDLTRDLMVLTLYPLQPQPYIAPSFEVKLPDLNNTADWQYGIDIHPNNASYYEFNPTSVKWFDLFTSSLNNLGQFILSQNADGSFKVEAPSYIGYNNAVLVLSAYNKIEDKFYTYSYSFTGGQQASTLPAFDGVTIAYNRKQKGWQTYFSYLPEMYGRLRNQVISFDNGILYLHDKGVGYNNFYGQQYGSSMKFILNKDYPKVKTPLSLWYRGNGSWSAKVSYSPNNMETEMLPANWRLQENGYSTEILRDRNDPMFTNPLEAWVNGQEIRGDYIEIELINDENTFASIDSEKTIYTYSEIS